MTGSITHQLGSLPTQPRRAAQRATEQSLHNLSTGKQINAGRDDPSGLIASQRLASELRIERQSSANAQRASNMLAYVESVLAEMQPMLLDVQNAIHAASSDATPAEREAAQKHIDKTISAFARLHAQSTYEGRPVLRYLPEEPDPTYINFESQTFTSITGQDGNAGSPSSLEVLDEETIELTGNTWRSMMLAKSYTVTPFTRVRFDFSSPSQGEIHAIAFEDDNAYTSNRMIKLYGTQSGGWVAPNAYPGDGWTHYEFAPSRYSIADFDRVTFVNDDDASPYTGVSRFRRLQIFEDLPSPTDRKVQFQFDLGSSGGNSRVNVAFDPPNPSKLGSGIAVLTDLLEGGSHDLESGRFTEAFAIVEGAAQQLATTRAKVGATRSLVLDPAQKMAEVAAMNLTDAISRLEDTDFALETAELARNQYLSTASQTMQKRAMQVSADMLVSIVDSSKQPRRYGPEMLR